MVAEFKKIYIAGKRGKIICAGDCYHVKNIKPENRLIFSSVDEALDKGCKRVCKDCLGTYRDDIWKVAIRRGNLPALKFEQADENGVIGVPVDLTLYQNRQLYGTFCNENFN